jgi:hypothetical protein
MGSISIHLRVLTLQASFPALRFPVLDMTCSVDLALGLFRLASLEKPLLANVHMQEMDEARKFCLLKLSWHIKLRQSNTWLSDESITSRLSLYCG